MREDLLDSAALRPRLAEVEAMMAQLAAPPPPGAAAAHAAAPPDVLGPMVREHLDGGGKRLRARLALAAAAAQGADAAAAVAWAAACELAHNATLVHDDLQDGDRVRRGQPTVWVRHGMAQAINVGDLMLVLPFSALAGAALPQALQAALGAALAAAMARVIRGQASEPALTAGHPGDVAAYHATVSGKTAALFELPVYGAALLAGASAAEAARRTAPFAPLGVLFQLQDDVLDLFGDKGREAPGSDLREGKISALVVEHLALHPGDAPALLALLRLPRAATPAADVAATIARFASGGALAAVCRAIATQSRAAEAAAVPPLAPLLCALTARVLRPIAHLAPAA